MSTYFSLGKAPSGPQERLELLALREGSEEMRLSIEHKKLRCEMVSLLTSQKGFFQEDLVTDLPFIIQLQEKTFTVTADIAVQLADKVVMVIKCVVNSMDSWQRHALAFGRVAAGDYQIPLSVVTDGETIRVINVPGGVALADGLDAMPSRDEALEILRTANLLPLPPDRSVREKMILHAFDGVSSATLIAD